MTTVTQKIPSGYKQTEIGVIPADWDAKTIDDTTECLDNLRIPLNESQRSKMQGDVPYCGANGVLDYVNNFVVNDDIILIAEDGGYFDEYAYRPIAYRMIGKSWVNNHAHILKAKADFDQGFIFYSLVHKNILNFLASGTRAKLNKSEMYKIQIAIPELKEQKLIADSLSDIDSLILGITLLIEKKKNIKQGAMQELLTGKRRLSGFKGEWKTKTLRDIADFERGQCLSKADLNDAGVYKCIHYGQLFTGYKELIGEVKSKTDVASNHFYSKTNDVLMPTSDVTPRGLATASCIREDGVVLGGGILVIRLHAGYDGLFLSHFITQNKNSILKLVKGSTVFHLYANDLANFEISFPEFEEQKAITQIFTDMDTEIEKLESQLTKYQNIKQGMMQTLLTGKIRLLTK